MITGTKSKSDLRYEAGRANAGVGVVGRRRRRRTLGRSGAIVVCTCDLPRS